MRKADNLPPSCAVVTKSGNLNFLEPSGPFQACNGTAFCIQLTYYIEQNPSRVANRFSASHEIPHILWNTEVHYRIHKCPPPVPFLSQIDSILHIPLREDPSYYFHPIYAWIFQVDSLPQVSPPKPCIHLYSPPIRVTCPAHLIILDLVTRTMLCEEYRSLKFATSRIRYKK